MNNSQTLNSNWIEVDIDAAILLSVREASNYKEDYKCGAGDLCDFYTTILKELCDAGQIFYNVEGEQQTDAMLGQSERCHWVYRTDDGAFIFGRNLINATV